MNEGRGVPFEREREREQRALNYCPPLPLPELILSQALRGVGVASFPFFSPGWPLDE